jgi:hypothetical protein
VPRWNQPDGDKALWSREGYPQNQIEWTDLGQFPIRGYVNLVEMFRIWPITYGEDQKQGFRLEMQDLRDLQDEWEEWPSGGVSPVQDTDIEAIDYAIKLWASILEKLKLKSQFPKSKDDPRDEH